MARYSFDTEYQGVVLAALVQDPVFLMEQRNTLDPSYFETWVHQEIARLLLSYYDNYRSRPNREALIQYARESATRFSWPDGDSESLLNECSRLYLITLNPGDVASVRVRSSDFGRTQALKTALLKGVELVTNYEADPKNNSVESIVPIMQRAISVGRASNTGIEFCNFMHDLSGIQALDTMSDPRLRVPTGVASIDKYLDGGLGAGEIGFVMAPSNKGKSMILSNFAAHAVRVGKPTVYFSFELKPFEIAARVAAKLSNTKVIDVKSNTEAYREKAAQLIRFFPNRSLRIVYLKPSEATVSTIRSCLMAMETEHRIVPGAIFVDYLDEMRGQSGKRNTEDDNSYNVYGNITSELLDLSVDYRCPLWTASQVNREGYESDPSLQHIGRSMQKIDKAEVVITIAQNKEEADKNKMRLIMLKNRRGGGKDKHIHCNVDFERASIYEVASSLNPDPGASTVPTDAS